jgi:hypothetical protein
MCNIEQTRRFQAVYVAQHGHYNDQALETDAPQQPLPYSHCVEVVLFPYGALFKTLPGDQDLLDKTIEVERPLSNLKQVWTHCFVRWVAQTPVFNHGHKV